MSVAHDSTTGANASLTSNRSISDSVSPARGQHLLGRRDDAGQHVQRIRSDHGRGVNAGQRASGPSRGPTAPLVIITAALPSDNGDELPGVISQLIWGNRAW